MGLARAQVQEKQRQPKGDQWPADEVAATGQRLEPAPGKRLGHHSAEVGASTHTGQEQISCNQNTPGFLHGPHHTK